MNSELALKTMFQGQALPHSTLAQRGPREPATRPLRGRAGPCAHTKSSPVDRSAVWHGARVCRPALATRYTFLPDRIVKLCPGYGVRRQVAGYCSARCLVAVWGVA